MRDLWDRRHAEQQLPLLPVATKPATALRACAARPWCRHSVGGGRQRDVWRPIAGRGAVALWLFWLCRGGLERLRPQCASVPVAAVGVPQSLVIGSPAANHAPQPRRSASSAQTTRHCDLSTRDCCNHRPSSAAPLTTLSSARPFSTGYLKAALPTKGHESRRAC